jgi:sporulation integral membrane protein YtvI
LDLTLVFRILRGIWVSLIVILAGLALYFVVPLIYPFIIGWIIAYILNPLVNLLHRKAKFPRWLASSTALLIFLGITSAFITLLVSKIVIEISKLSVIIRNNIEFWIEDIIFYINSEHWQGIINQIATFYSENEEYRETISQNLNTAGDRIAGAVSSIITYTVDSLFMLVTSLPNITFVFIIVLLAAFFISKDWYSLIKWSSSFFPEKAKKSGLTVWKDLQRALFGYIGAQLIMISITAAFVIIGLLILNVKYAVTIGLLIGLVDLLPYLGTGAVMIPWAVYLFIQGDISMGIGISILYGVILVARSTIEPKVLATSIGLNALATLVAMVVGLNLFGVAGIIIGPVSLVLILAVHRADIFRDIWKYIING